jgi:hypothetical protein
MSAAAGEPGAEIQALEDLTQRHALLDQPAVEEANDLGLSVINDQPCGHFVLTRHVAVTVRWVGSDKLAGASLLKLAAAESLAQQGALILRNGALDL